MGADPSNPSWKKSVLTSSLSLLMDARSEIRSERSSQDLPHPKSALSAHEARASTQGHNRGCCSFSLPLFSARLTART